MSSESISTTDRAKIDGAVAHFVRNKFLFEGFAHALEGHLSHDATLSPYIHFIKRRVKDPDHLADKLLRKAQEGELIDEADLFERITDLSGVRIIHLHTEQFPHIHRAILNVFDEQRLELIEPPTANCWDYEYEKIFKDCGIATQSRESMYSTVHYVVRANQKTSVACELQVRTLMDEVWGEVSHRVNYPKASQNRTCIDQLKVLARLTSGCTRLVDSIFRSHSESKETRSG